MGHPRRREHTMKVAKNKYGIEYIITAYNEDNEREIEQMVSKAMCAYANYRGAVNEHKNLVDEYGVLSVEVTEAQYNSEYEATVRCIGFFVEQPTSIICNYVIARCYEEFGI